MNSFYTYLRPKAVVVLLLICVFSGVSMPELALAQDSGWRVNAAWAVFIVFQDGSANVGTRYIVTVDIFKEEYRVERVQRTIAATCEPKGNVWIEKNIATFDGGYLVCKPNERGNFQSIVKELLAKSGYAQYIEPHNIQFGEYTNPFTAFNLVLDPQPVNGGYGTLVAHPDVSLNLVNQSSETNDFRLKFLIRNQDLLSDSDWGLRSGKNQFWVGQNVHSFLSLWGNQDGVWQQFLSFLPNQERFQDFANEYGVKRFFWHYDEVDAVSDIGLSGGPSDTDDLLITIGCDLEGNNCVHMKMYSGVFDPTCMGG